MPVGSDEAPLLHIVVVDAKQGEIVRKTNYDNPMYIPVRMKKFDTVEIDKVEHWQTRAISVQQVGSDTTFAETEQSNMTNFYMTLPSNSSMNYYPENTVTKCKTHRAQPISLEGDWEAGLFEFEYYRTWYKFNIEDLLSSTVI